MISSKPVQISKRLGDTTAKVAFVAFFLISTLGGGLYIAAFTSLNQVQTDSSELQRILRYLERDLSSLSRAAETAIRNGVTSEDLRNLRESFDALFANSRPKKTDASKTLQTNAAWAKIISEVDDLAPLIYPTDADLIAALPEVTSRTARIIIISNALRSGNTNTLIELHTQARESTIEWLNLLAAVALFGSLILMGALALARLQLLNYQANTVNQKRFHATLATVIGFSSDAMLVLDSKGSVLETNEEAMRLLGTWPPVSRLNEIIERIVQANDGLALKTAVQEAISTGPHATTRHLINFELQGADAAQHAIEAQLLPQLDETLLIILKDLSKQLNYKQRFENLQIDTQDEKRMTARFTAIMGHELRTPLNGIVASIELLKETTKLENQQLWLTNISEHYSRGALEQLDKLLELSRLLNPDRSQVPAANFRPADSIQTVVKQNQQVARENSNVLVFQRPPGKSLSVIGVERLFVLLLTQLIKTAARSIENSQINVLLTNRADPHKNKLNMTIRILGPNAEATTTELQPVMDNFRSLETAYTDNSQGSVLSLAIAKRAAEIMDGQVLLDSRPEQKCHFSITLELPMDENPPKPATLDTPPTPLKEIISSADLSFAKPLRLLVAEDDEIYRTLLVALLHLDEHDIVEAKDGQEAVELVRSSQFDAILMDISMPRMSGLTATKIIRGIVPYRSPPIIGLTAHALPEQIDEFLAAGMDDLIVKPAHKEAIRSTLYRSALRLHRPEESAPNPEKETYGISQRSPDLIETKVFDELLEMLDSATLRGYLDQFVKDCETALAALNRHLEAGDLIAAANTAHKTAGFASVVGANSVQNLLNEFETAAKSSNNAQCRALLSQIAEIIPQSHAALMGRLG